MKTAIAFFIFNRPDTTEKVFEAIRQAQPSKLLVVADGPRKDRQREKEKCAAARAVIKRVDWKCEVVTNYSDINLGCRNRIASGLNWVFDLVEEAIILEDDCLPHSTFFRFCEELLEYYRYDERIMSISGLNVQFLRKKTEHSYYFSHCSHPWGWATWKRAWRHYDVDMKLWPQIKNSGLMKNILTAPSAINYWENFFQGTYDKRIDTWDYQWIFTCWIQSGFTIVPNVNLISNIGFGVEATHTINASETSQYANMRTETLTFPLIHPPFMIRNIGADEFTQKTLWNPNLLTRANAKLKNILTNSFKKTSRRNEDFSLTK